MRRPADLSKKALRVLIVDDEGLARSRLEDLLATQDGVELVAAVDNGAAAVDAIRRLRPDLVFLDVQMPGRTGLDVVREVGPQRMPATIFVTAYDRYALDAFELAAVDYLVKPFDDERFEQAFGRARRALELEEVGRLSSRLLAVLEGGSAARPISSARSPAAYLQRIAVEMHGHVRVVPVTDIEYITASGPYVELHARDQVHLIRERMQTLEDRLDPDQFLRIHRSAIVRMDLIETLLRSAGGVYGIRLKGGARLKVSRGRFEELERRMGLRG